MAEKGEKKETRGQVSEKNNGQRFTMDALLENAGRDLVFTPITATVEEAKRLLATKHSFIRKHLHGQLEEKGINLEKKFAAKRENKKAKK